MKDLVKYGNECIENLEAIGYEFKKPIKFVSSGRMKRTWGLCSTSNRWDYTEVKIASFLLQDDVEEKSLLTTLYHELAHAIDENKHGHEREWQLIADTISDCYNVNIQQHCTKEEITALKNTAMYSEKCAPKRYAIICDSCGKTYSKKGYRAPKWYTHCDRFKCKCGGALYKKIGAEL